MTDNPLSGLQGAVRGQLITRDDEEAFECRREPGREPKLELTPRPCRGAFHLSHLFGAYAMENDGRGIDGRIPIEYGPREYDPLQDGGIPLRRRRC